MSFQKCQKCDSPATHKVTRVIDGQAVDFFLCQKHAAELSPLQQKTNQLDLAQLLAGLLKKEQGQKHEPETKEAANLQCPSCGLLFREYRKTWLLGCSHCYEVFEKHLQHDLRRHHGTVRHRGKMPEEVELEGTEHETVLSLQQRLAVAIEDEDFELAAQLRDQIREMTHARSEGQTDG